MAGKIVLAVVMSIAGLALLIGYGYIGWRGIKASAVNRDNSPFTRHQWHMVLGILGALIVCVGLGEVIALVTHVNKDPLASMAAGSGVGATVGVVLVIAYQATVGRRRGGSEPAETTEGRPWSDR